MSSPRSARSGNLDRGIAAFDFYSFLQGEGLAVEEKGTELRGTCPFCFSSARLPFCVNPDNGVWICHSCGEKGGPVRLVERVGKVTYTAALDKLANNFSYFIADPDEALDEDDIREVVVKNTIKLPKEYRALLPDKDSIVAKPYLDYVYGRGLNDALIGRYRIGYCSGGWYGGRVIVPVYHFGKLVNFVARTISKDPNIVKVDTPKGNEQGSYCFNLDNLWGERDDVLVMEGVFDVFALPEMSVATFTKKIGAAQVNLLRKAGMKKVIFCYDEDATTDAERFAEQWGFFFDTEMVVLPEGEDPSSLGRDRMLELLDRPRLRVV